MTISDVLVNMTLGAPLVHHLSGMDSLGPDGHLGCVARSLRANGEELTMTLIGVDAAVCRAAVAHRLDVGGIGAKLKASRDWNSRKEQSQTDATLWRTALGGATSQEAKAASP